MLKDIHLSKSFRRAVKKFKKRSKDLTKLEDIIARLQKGHRLPQRYRHHAMLGHPGCWNIHVEGDWVLIYRIKGSTLHLIATGSHADLF